MAQRRGRGAELAVSGSIALCSFLALAGEPEEGEAVPACARHFRCNSAQRAILPALVLKAVRQDLDRDHATAMLAPQYDPDWGNAAIETPSTHLHVELGIRCSPWRQHSNIGVVGDLQGALARSLRQATFGVGLPAPGDTPNERMPVPGARLLAEQFPILLPYGL